MARNFDGTSNRIAVTLAAAQTSLSQISYSVMLFPDNVDAYRRVFHWGGSNPAAGRNMTWEFDDGVAAQWVLNADWSTTSGTWHMPKPSTGAWLQAGFSYDWGATTNDPLMYQNGVSQTVTERFAPSGTAQNTATALMIGTDNANSGSIAAWDGRMAEYAYWNRILTAGEWAALGKGFSPLFFRRGLVFYMPLMGRISPEPDYIFGTTGTVTGATGTSHPKIIYPSTRQGDFSSGAVTPTDAFGSYRMMTGIGN